MRVMPDTSAKRYYVLIDPEKKVDHKSIISECNKHNVSGIMIGGSSAVIDGFSDFVNMVRTSTKLPIILFPGSHYQVEFAADAIFLLSLLNSSSTKYLIGEHLGAARRIYESDLEIITTAYLVITGNRELSVARQSNLLAVEPENNSLIADYIYAASIMKFDMLYLEAGSGTENPIMPDTVLTARKLFKGPITVGGGIRKPEQAEKLFTAGADCIVTGNIVEENPAIIGEFMKLTDRMNEIQH